MHIALETLSPSLPLSISLYMYICDIDSHVDSYGFLCGLPGIPLWISYVSPCGCPLHFLWILYACPWNAYRFPKPSHLVLYGKDFLESPRSS